MTAADAARYFTAYENAIHAIGRAAGGRGVVAGPGISVKLSALHPRYSRAQRERVRPSSRRGSLALAAARAELRHRLHIDAEEADRLDLSLDILERSPRRPSLADWQGLGFVVQTYQKRARHVIDWLVALARRHRRRLMVRLDQGRVLGQRDQARADRRPRGLSGVHAQGAHRRVAISPARRRCSRRRTRSIRSSPRTTRSRLRRSTRSQATQPYEFQCLHGMGESLYDQVVGADKLDRALPHLRAGRLARDAARVSRAAAARERRQQLVRQSHRRSRGQHRVAGRRSRGDGRERRRRSARQHSAARRPSCRAAGIRRASTSPTTRRSPTLPRSSRRRRCRVPRRRSSRPRPRFVRARPARDRNPQSRGPRRHRRHRDRGRPPSDVVRAVAARGRRKAGRVVGTRRPPRARPVSSAPPISSKRSARRSSRSRCARPARPSRTRISEVREAVDFLRYYAAQARAELAAPDVAPIGPVVAISPWNFPLAIFVGEVAAALAAGNPVLAKPAEQTPLIAHEAVRLLHRAGVPVAALQFLPGRGETVGAALVADPRVAGVIFTGSTDVARGIARRARGARRRSGADRRNRRPERDDRRQLRAARAGGRRRARRRPSTAPASAARRCACCACRRTSRRR